MRLIESGAIEMNLHGSDVEKNFDFSYREARASLATAGLRTPHELHGEANFFNMPVYLARSSFQFPPSAERAKPPEFYPSCVLASGSGHKDVPCQRLPNKSLMETELKNAQLHSSIRYVSCLRT
jgi:hypothetical protein